MSLQIESGSAAFLQQAHRNNWQKYLASLQPESTLGWEVCILTASDERQAGIYRRQLALRRQAGLLPSHTRFEVVADPVGRRIGSGGATLRVLAKQMGLISGLPPDEGKGLLAERTLVIHSGGDSRRLPHCSATGKLFARVPRELPDGRASTVFDEFLISLSGLTASLRPGVLIASGDVLLVFDHLQLSFQRTGVTGVAAAAPSVMGLHHGVYASDASTHGVRAYLHKPSAETLVAWGAVNDGSVQIDTGLLWLDARTAQRFAQLLHDEPVAALCGESPLGGPDTSVPDHRQPRSSGPTPLAGQLNLYGDLLMPLAESTTFESYLADSSDGPCTPDVQAARRVIWRRLRGTPFSFERLEPAVFIHFGTSAEYVNIALEPVLRRICGWVPHASAYLETRLDDAADRMALMNTAIDGPLTPGAGPALVVDSEIGNGLAWQRGALISGVRTAQALRVADDAAISQIAVSKQSIPEGWVTRVYGLTDNPKLAWDDPNATYLNRTWQIWLAEAHIQAGDIWPMTPAAERTLWNAQLFPVSLDREKSLRLALALQSPGAAGTEWLHEWRVAERLSLAECFYYADAERLLGDIAGIEDGVAIRRFYNAVERGQPATQARRWLGKYGPAIQRRSTQVIARLEQAQPIMQMHGYKALAVALDDKSYEDHAFTILAEMIGRSLVAERGGGDGRRAMGDQGSISNPQSPIANRQSPIQNRKSEISNPVRVEAAARIDFGGGWTDTPPYSIEHGGCVLNAAVTLRGAYPIVVNAGLLADPKLLLESKDIGARFEPQTLGDVLNYANPVDPFALHKAALVVRGIVPAGGDPKMPIAQCLRVFGAGVWLSTQTTIPRGSGLGTSSIMAGAVLQALHKLLEGDVISLHPSSARGERTEISSGSQTVSSDPKSETQYQKSSLLFDEVLWLEQLLTTGGGWQDQVGGLVGGLKLLTSAPGLPQRINIAPVRVPYHTWTELSERLLLVYTGQQRLAKGLLHAIVGRWMARDTDIAWMLNEIARLAMSMRDAFAGGDLDGVGWLLSEHWAINKRMDPGCSNPFIDDLFDIMRPFINGGKLAGAGGGGFALVLAKDGQAAHDLQHDLALSYRGTPVSVWPCEIAEQEN
jgi:fucokinase